MKLKLRFEKKEIPERREEEIPKEFAIWCSYSGLAERKVGFFVIEGNPEDQNIFRFLITEEDAETREEITDVCNLQIAHFAAEFSNFYFGNQPFQIENVMERSLATT